MIGLRRKQKSPSATLSHSSSGSSEEWETDATASSASNNNNNNCSSQQLPYSFFSTTGIHSPSFGLALIKMIFKRSTKATKPAYCQSYPYNNSPTANSPTAGCTWYFDLRRWVLRSLVLLVLLDFLVFYIRWMTMSRPSWLYGSPIANMDMQYTLKSCVVDPTKKPLGGHRYTRRRSLSQQSANRPLDMPQSYSSSSTPSPVQYYMWQFQSNTTIPTTTTTTAASNTENDRTPVTTTTSTIVHDDTTNVVTTVVTTTAPTSSDVATQSPIPMPKHRLLIAQYSGYGKYAEMLDLIAPINAAYAKHWGHDFLIVQGTAMDMPYINKPTQQQPLSKDVHGVPSHTHGNQNNSSSGTTTTTSFSNCPNDEPRSTFNKIPILEYALNQSTQYDQVLILDTDAMIVDFSVDITSLLPMTHLIAAHRVWKMDWKNTWDINAGITLWNLHHPTIENVWGQWKQLVVENPYLVLERNDDQYFLQRVLLEMGYWSRWVWSVTNVFEYYDATVIKHFKRDARSWSRTSLEQRMLRIQETIQHICNANNQNHGNNNEDEGGEDNQPPLVVECSYPLATTFSKSSSNAAEKPQGHF